MAREVRDQLVTRGRVRRGQLGVYPQEITQDLASGLGLKDRNGVLVADVDPNGAAAKAGIRRGDVIRKVNGQDVNTPNALRNRIAMTDPGSEVTLTIIRDGKEQEVKLRLGELRAAADTAEGAKEVALAQDGAGKLGVAVQPLTTDVARQLGLQGNVSGILIRDVDPAGLAAEAGIRPGDVIVEANRQPVRSTTDLQAALAKGGRTLLLVNRQGRTSYITIG
jgi:S1-C subfamily serine protease